MKTEEVLELMRFLESSKEAISLKTYALRKERSLRTIQRYISVLKKYYGNSLLKIDSDRYKLQNQSINSIFSLSSENELERLVDIYYFINPNIFELLEEDEKKFVKKMSKNNKECFFLQKSPFESFKNYEIVKQLKSCIKYKRYLNIRYFSDKEYFFENIKPIKIVFNEGNWYLATITQNNKTNNGFKWLRINFIKEVIIQKNSFIQDIDANNFINTFQNMFTAYKKENQKVILHISKDVARFFISKKHFRTQQILEKNKDGSLIIQIYSNNEMEIFPFIKKWLPHIKILEPELLDEKLKEEIKKYLTQFSN